METKDECINPKDLTSLLWTNEYSNRKNDYFTLKVQPFDSRLFVIDDRIREIDVENGEIIWESPLSIGVLSRGIYPLPDRRSSVHPRTDCWSHCQPR